EDPRRDRRASARPGPAAPRGSSSADQDGRDVRVKAAQDMRRYLATAFRMPAWTEGPDEPDEPDVSDEPDVFDEPDVSDEPVTAPSLTGQSPGTSAKGMSAVGMFATAPSSADEPTTARTPDDEPTVAPTPDDEPTAAPTPDEPSLDRPNTAALPEAATPTAPAGTDLGTAPAGTDLG
ncbi:hypothetical protein GT346_10900, partial [Streptomyces sp. SID161]|nr:hypothetical protein [Streptomyces sp. SID161]